MAERQGRAPQPHPDNRTGPPTGLHHQHRAPTPSQPWLDNYNTRRRHKRTRWLPTDQPTATDLMSRYTQAYVKASKADKDQGLAGGKVAGWSRDNARRRLTVVARPPRKAGCQRAWPAAQAEVFLRRVEGAAEGLGGLSGKQCWAVSGSFNGRPAGSSRTPPRIGPMRSEPVHRRHRRNPNLHRPHAHQDRRPRRMIRSAKAMFMRQLGMTQHNPSAQAQEGGIHWRADRAC